MYIKIYELNPPCFLTTTWLALQAALKKIKVKLDLLKVLKEEYVTLFINMKKLITKKLKIMIKLRNLHVLDTGM